MGHPVCHPQVTFWIIQPPNQSTLISWRLEHKRLLSCFNNVTLDGLQPFVVHSASIVRKVQASRCQAVDSKLRQSWVSKFQNVRSKQVTCLQASALCRCHASRAHLPLAMTDEVGILLVSISRNGILYITFPSMYSLLGTKEHYYRFQLRGDLFFGDIF